MQILLTKYYLLFHTSLKNTILHTRCKKKCGAENKAASDPERSEVGAQADCFLREHSFLQMHSNVLFFQKTHE